MRIRILAGVAAVTIVGAIGTAVAYKVDDKIQVAAAVDDFRLADHEGFAHSLRRLNDVDAVVLLSHINGDAGSRTAAKALELLKTKYPKVEFMMLNSALGATRDQNAAEAKVQGLTIPILQDEHQLAGEQLGVSYAGEAFVLQPRTLKVLYHGNVDGAGKALADIAAGKMPSVAKMEGSGTEIAFPERQRRAQHAQISYEKDVAPILMAKCVSCHQDGGIGPFAMKDYAVVKGFAPMIREALRTDSMPPWYPDTSAMKLKHDGSLSNEQIKTIVHWVEAGAPRAGGPDPLAAVATVAPEWPNGKPDLILNIPSHELPASGVVDYQTKIASNPTTKSRWVKASAFLPGDRRAVHHILAGHIPGKPLEGPASMSQWQNSYGQYGTGGAGWEAPEGWGVELPASGHMGFQMHYTPYGKASVDNSKMGLYFYPEGETPTYIMRNAVIIDPFMEVEPGKDMHKEISYLQFPKEAILFSAMFHTHVRGQAARLEMIEKDGKRTTLLNLPRFDFNWQTVYHFEEPVRVPAGAKIVSNNWYDNSTRSGSNPDPKQTVVWGDQSWEEMLYTSLFYQWTDERVGAEADATKEMLSCRMFCSLDDNLDEKIQLAEMNPRIRAAVAPKFAEFDVNKDGGIDKSEFKPVLAVVQPILANERANPAPRPMQTAQANR